MNKAIIFDMDGVISDTLSIHCEAESKLLLKHGIKISPSEILKEFNAVPDLVMLQILSKRFKRNLDFKKVEDEKWELFQKLAKEGIQPIPGSLKFIDTLLENNFSLAVASSAPLRIVNLVLETLGIKKKFKAVVYTTEVKQGKPSPDIFLLAAEKIKVNPRDCIVIEDAAKGIQAAKAAGMKCIAISTTHMKKELKKADKIIDNFSEIEIEELRNL